MNAEETFLHNLCVKENENISHLSQEKGKNGIMCLWWR
jgi:hypothetical protein